ncbi:MAG: helix-turn-helix domain-containing protein, partial [Clostridiaceae bacterium]
MANNDTEKSDRWTEFNLIIDNEKLTHDEKLLLLIIFRYVNNGSKKSYPSIETLKRVYGTKRNETIFNKLKNLYSKGYLIKNQGFQNRNEYTIVFPKNEPCTENVSSNEKRNEVLPKNGRI